MMKIIWNAVLLGVIALAAAWLSNNSGLVVVEWLGYRVQTSVAVVVGTFVVLYAVFYAFLAKPLLIVSQKVTYWLAGDKRAQKIAKAKVDKEIDRYTVLGQGLTALAAGDVVTAKKLAGVIRKKFADDEAKTNVFMAQLAEADNNPAEALRLYAVLSDNAETRLLGMRGRIRLYRLMGDQAKALSLCSELLTMKNPPAWVLSEAFEMQVQGKQWPQALTTLDLALKVKHLDKLTVKRLKASVLLEQAAGTTDETERQALIRQANSTDETFVRAAIQTAELDVAAGEIKHARRSLQKLWKLSPSWAVYQVYLTLTGKESPIEAVKDVEELIAENPHARLNNLIFADCSLKAHLWGQAKNALNKYLAVYPESRRALLMAEEIAAFNQDDKAADEYRAKAAEAPVEQPYYCEVCHTQFDKDYTTCPVCHTLGAIHLSDI